MRRSVVQSHDGAHLLEYLSLVEKHTDNVEAIGSNPVFSTMIRSGSRDELEQHVSKAVPKMGVMPTAGHLLCKQNDWVRFPHAPLKNVHLINKVNISFIKIWWCENTVVILHHDISKPYNE